MRKILSKLSIPSSKTIIYAIILFSIFFNLKTKIWNGPIISYDSFNYYSYLPASFIKHDLTFSFLDTDKVTPFNNLWLYKLSNGNKLIRMTMGVSIMESPFFFIAHYLSPILGYPQDGFSFPYVLSLSFSPLFYACLGLILLRKILRKYFDDKVVMLTLLVTFCATNL